MRYRESEFNESGIPLAYFISFRCYGTWLHGDERGSVDHSHNTYGTPMLMPDEKRRREMRSRMKRDPVELTATRRAAVEEAVRETCDKRKWVLKAINVRTNHVHCVVTAIGKPEPVMNAFKANATRKMVDAGALQRGIKPWSRHGSTRYLWTEESVARASYYVINCQGDDLPNFDSAPRAV
jgi:REP element-mobilizing transposase RayT